MRCVAVCYVLVAMVGGCLIISCNAHRAGIASPATQIEPWGSVGEVVVTPHYRIYSTLRETDTIETRDAIAAVLEAAYPLYQAMAPPAVPTTQPLECLIFQTRAEWEAATEKIVGPRLAPAYLQIGYGGYTFEDRFVAYYLTHERMISLSAHEGWHQYARRHYAGRLPPSLEEGLACTFEEVCWIAGQPIMDREHNRARAVDLAEALDDGKLWPLEKFVTMHAGQVLTERARIGGFYAQCWAWARFLEAGDNGSHAAALQRLLVDVRDGRVFRPPAEIVGSKLSLDDTNVRAMYRYYFGMEVSQMEPEFRKFARRLASSPGSSGGQ